MRYQLILLCALASVARAQPSPPSFRVTKANLDVRIDYGAQALDGSMTYELENWTRTAASTVPLLLNRLMTVRGVRLADGRTLRVTSTITRFSDDPMFQVARTVVTLPQPVPAGGRITLRIAYDGNLVGYTEVGMLYVNDRIDTSFTILREDALAFPVIGIPTEAANHRIPRVDFPYRVRVRVPADMRVASGGSETRAINADGTITSTYVSQGPSPFLVVAIARFDTLSSGGIRIFHARADSLGAHRILQRSRAALDSLRGWFGPLHTPATLTITEIPEGWGSQASLVGGIIQTEAAFRDSTRLGELYHELTHLWNAQDLERPSPRWNEGLASFLESTLSEQLDGWTGRAASEGRLIERLRALTQSDSVLRQTPFIRYGQAALTDRSYSVGRLMFAVLHEIVGADAFHRIVRDYYQSHAAGGTTRDFTDGASRSAGIDLSRFFDDWIYTTRWTGQLSDVRTVAELARGYRR